MGRVIWLGAARNPAGSWREAGYLASNSLFFALTWPGAYHTRVRWAQLQVEPDRPLLYLMWHARIWTAPAVFRAAPAPLRPALVAHDGILSRLNQRCGAWSGLDVVVFARRSQMSPTAQLVEYVRTTGRHLLIAPDSGAQPGLVRPGVLELARATSALIVPLRVAVRRAPAIGRQSWLVPGSRVDVRHGALLDGGATADDVRYAMAP